MFKIMKLDATTYVVATDKKCFRGTKIQAGNYAIQHCGADVTALCEVIQAFEHDDKNYADFGVNGQWTFIDRRGLGDILPHLTRGVA